MKRTSGEAHRTVLKLEDDIEIKANALNWLLVTPPRNCWYYPSLDDLFIDLLDYKIKFYASKTERHTIEELRDAIQKAREEVWRIVSVLTNTKTLVSERLETQGSALKGKEE